uniref:Hemicentin-1-like isoform X3 n=1 Tax=Crassostrea virginica TaxID=6565 RepID=A0A8B8EZK4_CRAVI|nr:hemicentin-1-like isoform X3 [Crassostrea virginica]
MAMQLPQPSMFKKLFMLMSLCVSLLGTTTEGQQYNMTGSSEFAVLGKDFTWTCEMFVPPRETTNGVRFLRNNASCAQVGHVDGTCFYGILNTRYTYGCSSPFSYTLTIPAENMTEYEQGSMWMCEYFYDSGFRSLVVTLHLAVDVHNVSLIPSDNPLTLAEGFQKMVRCEVNSNAVPAPTITWYIINMVESYVSSIIIAMNRKYNNKTLECKATNNNKPSKTGATTLNVEYPPSVIPLTQKDAIEGQYFLIICRATPGNPITTMFWWIKVNDPVFRQNGSILELPSIQRNMSGTYKCIAENTYSSGWKGTDSQEMVVNVLYKPVIKGKVRTFVNETNRVVLTREIDSNPLSNISWYDGTELLKTQTFAEITNLTVENASCTDTKNFTLSVSNAVQRNVESMVELIVNCKPKAENDEITIAITSATRRISMSTTVMAYPEPRYILKYENGTKNQMMTVHLQKNAINNFTVHCEQQFAQEIDSVTYILELSNVLGVSTVFIRILKQVDVHNVSLIPSDNPLTLAEGFQKMVRCEVNSNAVPAPTITWYLGSSDITNMVESYVSSIIITVNREYNNKTLACMAINNNKISKTGATTLNVEYPPSVISLTQKDAIEGQYFLIICRATPGNPITTMFWWIKVNDPVFRQNGSILELPSIQRNMSGTYKCIAENTYISGWKGTDSQEMVVNVLYKPVIRGNTRTFVNETNRVVLTREIDSNPLSNISWYDGTELLMTQTFAEITNLTVENASCTDTKNFTLSVSNAVQRNVESMVELIINCKPKADDDEITIAITSATRRISMSTTVMAYPEPRYILKYENGTKNQMMTVHLQKNAINNFTVHCEQQFAQEIDSVTYILELSNVLGVSTVFIRILKQVDVHNVSLIPSDNPMTLAEGVYYMVRCVVNSNAVPAPTITWYMGSTDITNMAGSNASSIIITVNREHNNRMLECKATNNNKPSKTGATTLNVEYPPSVIPLTQKDTIEGQDFLISCRAIPGNPITTMFWWIKVNDPEFRQNGSTLELPSIQRNRSGTYKCITENTYSNGWKGTDSQEMVVNVLYKPVIRGNIRTFVNETNRVVLTREIDSNPLSNISWYDGSELLKTQTFAEIANLTIENASCTDTKNFTLSVSNAVQRNVESMVELIVNCKPKAEDVEITIVITSATRRISMSTTVMAYPEPRYILKYENGTRNNMMTVHLQKNAINNFTVHCEQQFAQEMDSVTYILELSNVFGASTVFIRILKQEKPSPPTIIEAECEGTGARLKWKSSFDGGAVQFFFVVALSDTYKSSRSDIIRDKGENQTHQTVVPFLRPSVLYTFYVFAKNSIGVTLSEELNCTTLKDIPKTSNTSNQTFEVVGSVAGVVVVLTLAIVLSCFVHRHFTLICNIGFQRRSTHVKTADLIEEKSHYTAMSEQESENERNPYDVLTPTESSNQYEAIQMKESQKTDANTNECLSKPENIPPCDNPTNDSNKPGILKKTDASSSSNTEEYTNTSFVN